MSVGDRIKREARALRALVTLKAAGVRGGHRCTMEDQRVAVRNAGGTITLGDRGNFAAPEARVMLRAVAPASLSIGSRFYINAGAALMADAASAALG